MIGSPEYELAKFLDSLIRSYIPDTYMLRSSQEFVKTLKNFQFKPNHKLVSFDVKSLFTNVPLEETIDFIANTIYADDTNIIIANTDQQRSFQEVDGYGYSGNHVQ